MVKYINYQFCYSEKYFPLFTIRSYQSSEAGKYSKHCLFGNPSHTAYKSCLYTVVIGLHFANIIDTLCSTAPPYGFVSLALSRRLRLRLIQDMPSPTGMLELAIATETAPVKRSMTFTVGVHRSLSACETFVSLNWPNGIFDEFRSSVFFSISVKLKFVNCGL